MASRGNTVLVMESDRPSRHPQVIFALPPVGDTDLTMRIYNSDGSEHEMCGNGIRCLARFVADVDGAKAKKYKIHTLAGLIQPELLPNGQVCVDMGEPILEGPKVCELEGRRCRCRGGPCHRAAELFCMPSSCPPRACRSPPPWPPQRAPMSLSNLSWLMARRSK